MIEKDKIKNIILDYCCDDKPSDCEWTLSKSDLPEMVEKIKEAVLNEIDDAERQHQSYGLTKALRYSPPIFK